jgi:hypothetical protein
MSRFGVFYLSLLSLMLMIAPWGTPVSRCLGAEPLDLSLEQVAQAVVLLHASTATGDTSIGSGFVVNLTGRLFLVTAEHVAMGVTGEGALTYGGQADQAMTTPLGDLVRSQSPQWVRHGTADVAARELRTDHPAGSLLLARALPPALFSTKLASPPRERPLTTIGYPLGLGGLLLGPDKRISPLTRESRPASGLLTLLRFDTHRPAVVFLLDNPSIGGFSGAPVFLLPSAHAQGGGLVFSAGTFCVGLVHGTLSDSTGGKLAAIVPVAFITEVLEQAYDARTP